MFDYLDWKHLHIRRWRAGSLPRSAAVHPAKFPMDLIVKIYNYGQENSMWGPKSIFGDPFAGVGIGGLYAYWLGYKNWLGTEIVPAFVDAAHEVFKLRHCPPGVREVLGDAVYFADEARRAYPNGLDAVITGAPGLGCLSGGGGILTRDKELRESHGLHVPDKHNYGDAKGQLANQDYVGYWKLMDAVFHSVYKALAPGGWAVVQCKDYVKEGKRVRHSRRVAACMRRNKLRPKIWARSWLTWTEQQATLYGDVVREHVSMSFFARIQRNRQLDKGGQHVDWEDVIFARKEAW